MLMRSGLRTRGGGGGGGGEIGRLTLPENIYFYAGGQWRGPDTVLGIPGVGGRVHDP